MKNPRKQIPGKATVISKEENLGDKSSANVSFLGIVHNASIFFTNSKNSTWIIDTGASDHMTNDSGHLHSILPSPRTIILQLMVVHHQL